MQDSQPSTFIKASLRQLATWFGCGRIGRAPGTMGTLGAVPLVWTFGQLGPIGYMIATLGFTALAILVSQFYLDLWSEESDPQEIVIDEVVGFLITMVWLPFDWKWLISGFVLFRALDILKPFPISACDRKIKGGLGVVADDMVAGIIASMALQFIFAQGWMP